MDSKNIKFVELCSKYLPLSNQYHKDLDRVLSSGSFILGSEVARLEANVKHLTNGNHAIGVGNGTDALILSMKAMNIGPGDEVITTPMSYLASASSIAQCGATAVFVDVDNSLNIDPKMIEQAITKQSKAILVVHMAGIPAHMEKIMKIANRHRLSVIEDCAQAFGAKFDGRSVGTFGRFGTFSFHPLKNPGTIGDGGLILAKNERDANWIFQARNHGHNGRDECDFWSINSRLDEIHAAFLNSFLDYLPDQLIRRKKFADIYRKELAEVVSFPKIPEMGTASYNWFMILASRRQELIEHLIDGGIETKIHYPRLIPDLKAAKNFCRTHGSLKIARTNVERILSIPSAEHISEDNLSDICKQIKSFWSLFRAVLQEKSYPARKAIHKNSDFRL